MVYRRYNPGMALRPVHRIKHVIDSQQAVVAATPLVIRLIDTVDAPVLANTTEVETGAKVNGIYLRVEVNATTEAALPNCYMYLFKNPGNNLTLPGANTVGSNDNKRYVIHQEMVMLSNSATPIPRTLFNGVVAIPKGYRRFGPDDTIDLVLLAPGVNIEVCIQCHYKEFR